MPAMAPLLKPLLPAASLAGAADSAGEEGSEKEEVDEGSSDEVELRVDETLSMDETEDEVGMGA